MKHVYMDSYVAYHVKVKGLRVASHTKPRAVTVKL
jgi:hypothetical protein